MEDCKKSVICWSNMSEDLMLQFSNLHLYRDTWLWQVGHALIPEVEIFNGRAWRVWTHKDGVWIMLQSLISTDGQTAGSCWCYSESAESVWYCLDHRKSELWCLKHRLKTWPPAALCKFTSYCRRSKIIYDEITFLKQITVWFLFLVFSHQAFLERESLP